jgi:hypothetical protein
VGPDRANPIQLRDISMLGALFPADMPLAARFFIVGLLLLIIIIAVDIVLLLLSRRRIHASHWHGERSPQNN